MELFKKILFPVDFSETPPKLVPYVKAMAERFESEVHILFVARILDYFSMAHLPDDSIADIEKNLMERARKQMSEFKETYFQGIENVRVTVVGGDVLDEIMSYISSENIDVVIMGTHGRKGLDKIVFGSVAGQVVKSSPVPVLLINPHKIPS